MALFIFIDRSSAGPGILILPEAKERPLIFINDAHYFTRASLTAVGVEALLLILIPGVGIDCRCTEQYPGFAVAIDSTNSPMASIACGIVYPFGSYRSYLVL